MKTIKSIILICIVVMTAQLKAQGQQPNVTITAKVKGMPGEKWLYFASITNASIADDSLRFDSVKTDADGFTIRLHVATGGDFYGFSFIKKTVYTMFPSTESFQCYLEPANNVLVNTDGDFSNAYFSGGSRLIMEQNDFKRLAFPKSSSLFTAKNKKFFLTAASISLVYGLPEKIKPWVRQHPDSKYSAALLSTYCHYPHFVHPDTLLAYADLLTEQAKSCKAGEYLETIIQSSKAAASRSIKDYVDTSASVAVGKPVPDFTQLDTAGKPVSLHDLKGKFVLIDFWASWCGPCRAENPNVVKAYNAYKDKNFTIISVSLDNNEANWAAAIKKDGLPWAQVSDLLYWKNAIALKYGVKAVPANFLIGPDGVLIARDLRGDDLTNTLNKLLIK
jgi:peroxiredoxin